MLTFDKEFKCLSEYMTLGEEWELWLSVFKKEKEEMNSACGVFYPWYCVFQIP